MNSVNASIKYHVSGKLASSSTIGIAIPSISLFCGLFESLSRQGYVYCGTVERAVSQSIIFLSFYILPQISIISSPLPLYFPTSLIAHPHHKQALITTHDGLSRSFPLFYFKKNAFQSSI